MATDRNKGNRQTVSLYDDTIKCLKKIGKIMVPEDVKPPSYDSIILKISKDWIKHHDSVNDEKQNG